MRSVSIIKKLSWAFLVCSVTLFFSLNPALSSTTPSKKPLEMTLAEAINVALRLNRSVKSAYLSRVVEKFNLRVAQDKFNPNVDFTAGP
jgi:outer membrane protein TolC